MLVRRPARRGGEGGRCVEQEIGGAGGGEEGAESVVLYGVAAECFSEYAGGVEEVLLFGAREE